MADYKPDRALVTGFAASLQFLKPDDELMQLWLNTMASGDYAFGYGLLRSDADAYDPFGVLVALNGGDWVWDDQDEAWGFANSATTLNPLTMMKWLGMERNHGLDWANNFLDSVTLLTDRSTDFTPIVAVLREALIKVEDDRGRINDASQAAYSRGVQSIDSPFSHRETRRNYDAAPFYGRRV